MVLGVMFVGIILLLAVAYLIYIKAVKQENMAMKVIGFIIAGLLLCAVVFGPMYVGFMHGNNGGGMMSGGMMGGAPGGMMSGMMGGAPGASSGGMSCPMMSGGGMAGMGSGQKMDPNMISIQGTVMNGKNGAMLKIPMIDNMRDEMMKSDFFIEQFAKSAVEKPDFVAKLKAQIAKAEEEAKKMMK